MMLLAKDACQTQITIASYGKRAQVVSFGHLPSRDEQRWAPLGFYNSIQTTLTPYLLATIYRISRLIGFEASLESVTKVYPVIVFALLAFVLYFLSQFLFDATTALFAVIALSMDSWLLLPTTYAHADHDAFSIFLSSTALLLYMVAIKKEGKIGLCFALGAGILMALLAMTWEGVGVFALVILRLWSSPLPRRGEGEIPYHTRDCKTRSYIHSYTL